MKRVSIGIICIFFGVFVGIMLREFVVPNEREAFFDKENITIVCDAGHGEPDGGAVGLSGTLEKDINLDIASKVCEILENRGAKVIMTRSGDSGIFDADAQTIRQKKLSDMHKRLEIINKSNADLFISIHMNSFEDKKANGVNVFYNKDDEMLKESANNIMQSISKITGATGHQTKHTSDSLYLMQKSSVPGILIECGFLSNPKEEKLLKDENYRSKIAWAIAEAISSYH